MIVVDASALVDMILQTPIAARLEQRLAAMGETLHAPHLVDVEVAHALRRHAASGVITAARGRQALTDLAELRLERYPHQPIIARVWELRNNLSAYDAAYVALAEALDAPLVTRDRRLANAPGHRAQIELI